MNDVRVAILGAASLRYGFAIIGSLANVFGERPIELRLMDGDEERLDLFDRLARAVFAANRCSHRVLATLDPEEALADADGAVVALEPHGARKLLRQPALTDAQAIERALLPLAERIAAMPSLALIDADACPEALDSVRRDWLAGPDEETRVAIPYQALRWIRGEEPAFELAQRWDERNLLHAWLADVESARMSG